MHTASLAQVASTRQSRLQDYVENSWDQVNGLCWLWLMRTREGCRELCIEIVPVPWGRKFLWPWISLEMTSGLLDLSGLLFYFRPGVVVFLLAPKLSQCFCHLQQHCRSHLLSETTLRLLSLFLQISNSTDSDCAPKIFVISTKVRMNPALLSVLYVQNVCGGNWETDKSSICWRVTLLWKFDRALVFSAAVAHIYVASLKP